jgi:signal transduction histidine kinase
MARISYAEQMGARSAHTLVARAGSLVRLGEPAWRYFLGVGALVLAYYASAHLGYAFEFAGPVAAIVWLPVGVAIAFLYLGGLQYWPGVVAGDLLVNNYSTLPLGSALGQTCGNLLEVVVAAALLRRLCPRGAEIGTISGVAKTLISIAAGTVVSATVGALSLRLGQVVTTSALPHVWRTWWLGDFCGALIVLPLVLAWSRPPLRPWPLPRVLEGAAMLATLAVLSEIAFHTRDPLTYIVFPGLIWAALRFEQRGTTLAIAMAVGFTLWNTTHYAGPFALHSHDRDVLDTQLFIAVAAMSTLLLGALVSERRRFASDVQASRSRLLAAADAERRRLERNLHDGAQQRLVALAARLGVAGVVVRDEPARAAGLFATAEAEVLTAIEELREIAHGLHPPVLDEFGLSKALDTVVARSAIPVKLVEVVRDRLDRTAEVTAYYILLEAITNAHRHSRASVIRVRATLNHSLHVEVFDDGVGGAVERAGGGLLGLRDRVEAIGGSFAVHSELGRGTRVAAVIPASLRRLE